MKNITISENLYNYIAELMEILNIDTEEEIIWNLIAACNISKKDIYDDNRGYE